MVLHDKDSWGAEMAELYKNELVENTENELWENQKSTNIETPEVKLSAYEVGWGEEMARLYQEGL